MGYYEPDDTYETTTDFICDECGHENENADASHTGRYSDTGDVTCSECGNEQEVELGSGYCNCPGDVCRC